MFTFDNNLSDVQVGLCQILDPIMLQYNNRLCIEAQETFCDVGTSQKFYTERCSVCLQNAVSLFVNRMQPFCTEKPVSNAAAGEPNYTAHIR